MKLYEIRDEIEKALFEIDLSEDNENRDKDEARINALLKDFDEKVDNICAFLKNLGAEIDILEAQIETFKDEIKGLTQTKKAIESKAEDLKRYLMNQMLVLGKTKAGTGIHKATIRRNPPSVKVEVPSELPPEFQRIQITADKHALIQRLKQTGEVVDGVTYHTDKKSLVIR